MVRRAGSRIQWALGAVMPWCMASALIISFTATAGQDRTFGASRADLGALEAERRAGLSPLSQGLLMGTSYLEALPDTAYIQARLVVGDASDLNDRPDELPPRIALKANAGEPPQIDRSHKGDPLIGLRPGFEARWRAPAGAAKRSASLIFDIDENLPVANFTIGEGDVTGPGAVLSFEPPQENDNFTARKGDTPRPFQDGATPALPRAIGLSSTTPVALDQAPIEIAGVSELEHKALGTGGETIATRVVPSQPDYAALISTASLQREQKCLAEAIYFEARSELEAGQAAVAQVVLNRVNSGLYPTSVCGVVYQNRSHYKACQFSFACEGKSLRITEPDSWAVAQRIAREVTQGKTYLAHVGPSTHYHANYVRPRWASRLKKMDKIGNHIFYKLRPGQT